ncbi:ABC transporter related [Catenulispora acidiphila DSM 44928]|uniref:ABC transporter related n=1 Tax=Catenulispora acidiphila (strain DSM 44928 / JCM 14897 / NBRC 102108 / NRRL B-24433 / ID139908) TaxID=479433 RepID=C7Q6X4_CATAD|nr:ABC transporter ATP-binding protein [Catenulispora acidiphila]ACU75987.1 ABC transporter related [Catenulispora acidiphila DSM 44928]
MGGGILVEGLTKRYQAVTAVDDLTFEVEAGKVTAFLGPNGAGKTTTLRMILGLVRPDAGRALIDGFPYARLPHPRRAVGAVLETGGFHPGRSGRDHLRVLAMAERIPATRVDDVLVRVGLADAADRRVKGYSLGMRQRLGLASALLGDPAVLILDEPANGLDPAGMAELRELLRDLAAEGRTVVMSSHVLSEVAQTVDHVVIAAEGRLRYAGRLADLTAPQGETLEAAFLRLTASAATTAHDGTAADAPVAEVRSLHK